MSSWFATLTGSKDLNAVKGITLPTTPASNLESKLAVDLRQISINSIDRLDFWPFSRLSSTQRHGDRLDRLDRLYT